MIKTVHLFCVWGTVTLLSSCHNKSIDLISKKWNCVQVENILPPNAKFLSSQDSIDAIRLQTLLKSINWTFFNSLTYECEVNNNITVKGTYEIDEKDRTLVLTPNSRNNINRYIINSLTGNELVLSGSAENKKLVLHFRPN